MSLQTPQKSKTVIRAENSLTLNTFKMTACTYDPYKQNRTTFEHVRKGECPEE